MKITSLLITLIFSIANSQISQVSFFRPNCPEGWKEYTGNEVEIEEVENMNQQSPFYGSDDIYSFQSQPVTPYDLVPCIREYSTPSGQTDGELISIVIKSLTKEIDTLTQKIEDQGKIVKELYIKIRKLESLLYATGKDRTNTTHIDLSSYLTANIVGSFHAVGTKPIYIRVSEAKLKRVYLLSDQCECSYKNCTDTLKNLHEAFSPTDEAQPWAGMHFGYRDRRTDSNMKPGREKEKKYYLQFSRDYIEWVQKYRPEEINNTRPLKELFFELLEIEKLVQDVLTKAIDDLIDIDPAFRKLYHNYGKEKKLLISMRITTYKEYLDDESLTIQTHRDRTVLTLLFPSDDDPDEELLIIAPISPETGEYMYKKLSRPIRPRTKSKEDICALLIPGGMIKDKMDIPIDGSLHAVLPHTSKERHVLIFGVNFPFLDTSLLDYMSPLPDPIVKDILKKFRIKQKGKNEEVLR